MNPPSRFQRFLPALVLAFVATSLRAQNVELDIERSVKVEFNSQKGYSYNVYGTSDPAQKTGWKLLGGEEGTGDDEQIAEAVDWCVDNQADIVSLSLGGDQGFGFGGDMGMGPGAGPGADPGGPGDGLGGDDGGGAKP